MKFVIDSNGWYAGLNSADNFHPQAKKFLTQTPLENFIVPYTVFNELMALILNRKGKKTALASGTVLRDLEIYYLVKNEEKEVWGLFNKSTTEVSYVDCSVAVISKKLGLPVFTFDKHLAKLGVQVVP